MEKNTNYSIIEKGTIDPVYPKKEFIKDIIIWALIWGFCAIFAHLMMWGISSSENVPLEASSYAILWGTTIGTIILCSLLGYWYASAYTKRFEYEMTNEFIVIRKGVFTREKCTIPFSRIQNITVNQGIIDRLYGIYTVKIETAGVSGVSAQGGAAASEGYIPGIRNPSKIEKIINELVHGYTQKPFIDEKLKGKVFDNPNLAFDEFISYFLTKIVEGKPVETRIKELREKINMSQADLAEKVGVSRQTINYIENGRIMPSYELAVKIARVFKMNVEQVLIIPDEN